MRHGAWNVGRGHGPVLGLILLLMPFPAAWADGNRDATVLAPAESNGDGTVVAATVYHDRALVVRSLEVDLARGANRVEITGLPPGLDQDSLRATAIGPAGTVLEGFETRTETSGQIEDPAFQAAEAELQQLQQQRQGLNDRIATIRSQREFLDAIRATLPQDLGRRLTGERLDPSGWQGAFDFIGANLDGLAGRERGIQTEIPGLDRKIAAARDRIEQLRSKGNTRTLTAIVTLQAPERGSGEVRVEYLTGPAGWYPLYEARYDRDRRRVEFLEKGMVRQETGEDWTGIDLVLSTARPGRPLDLPEIRPLPLSRASLSQGGFIEGLPVVGRDYRDMLIKEGVADEDGDGNVNIHGGRGRAAMYSVNGANVSDGFAGQGALFELANAQSIAQVASAVTTIAAQTIVIHAVPLRQDLPSDGEFHRFRIAQRDLEAVEEEFRAAPRFQEGAFLRVKVRNEGGHPYLGGKVVAFDGSNLLGAFGLQERAPGEEFTIPFGSDPRFRARRQRLSRVIDAGSGGWWGSSGKTTTVRYRFRTTLESFHGDARSITLEDQIPVSENDDIVVKMLPETTPGWEKNPEVPGLLRWKVALEPQEKREIDLAYEVRFPSDWSLPNLE